jgi:hypothetical protein
VEVGGGREGEVFVVEAVDVEVLVMMIMRWRWVACVYYRDHLFGHAALTDTSSPKAQAETCSPKAQAETCSPDKAQCC